jgi:DNA-binding transcriptional LysR family regulator
MVERNVTRAAAQLAMTQPAVSNALRRLREATGDELFVTVPGGVRRPRRPKRSGRGPVALDSLRQAFDPQGSSRRATSAASRSRWRDATATVLMPR